MKTTLLQRLLRPIYNVAQHVITLDITHLMILDRKSLKQPVCLPDYVKLCRLTAEQVRHYAKDDANHLDAALADRISLGRDFCVAALIDGRLVAYAWYALGSIEAENNCGRTVHSGTAISFPDEMAFLYKAFTHPDFRGRGLYRHVNNFALDYLKRLGITAILATTDWSNFPALQSCYGLGFKRLGNIWRFGFGSHVAGVYPIEAKKIAIRFGRAANVAPRSIGRVAQGVA